MSVSKEWYIGYRYSKLFVKGSPNSRLVLGCIEWIDGQFQLL